MSGQQSNYIAFLPQAKALQEHITHYYFHSRASKGLPLEFSYYPHINHAITAYCGSITQSTATQTLVKAKENSFTALYSRLQEQAHHVQIHGTFYKLGIGLTKVKGHLRRKRYEGYGGNEGWIVFPHILHTSISFYLLRRVWTRRIEHH